MLIVSRMGPNPMDAPELQPPPPAFKRRWYQYSLRSLMIFVMVCGVLLGWAGSFFKRLHEQREAVSRIQGVHGVIDYDYQYHDNRYYRHAPPPGPKLLRMVLGDDAFARIERVSFNPFKNYTPPKDEDLEALEGLYGLHHLIFLIGDNNISDEGLRHLAGLTNLRTLVLTGHKISDKGLEHLVNLTNLENLGLDFTQVTTEGIARLPAGAHLRQLWLYGPSVKNSTLTRLDALTSLDTFYLEHSGVTDAGLAPLARLSGLQVLSISDCPAITDAGLEYVRNLNCLKELILDRALVTDDGIQELRGLRKLTWLSLDTTMIGDAGVACLANLSSLRYLNLNGTPVSDAALSNLAQLPRLRYLTLSHTQITEEGASALRRLTGLKRLTIGPEITRAAAVQLGKALPKCTIEYIDANGDAEDLPLENDIKP